MQCGRRRTGCYPLLLAILVLGLAACGAAPRRQGPVTGLPGYRPRHEPRDYGPTEVFEPERLELTFTGDIMAHRVISSMSSFGDIYDGVRHTLRGDDLSFANLEFPVDPTRPYAGYPRFNVHPEFVVAAIEGGFDVFSLANNHSTDHGPSAIAETRRALRELAERHGIRFSGLREAAGDPIAVETIRHGDWRIAFLAVTLFVNDPSRGVELVQHVDLRRPASRQELEARVRRAAGEHDAVVVSVHGGLEYRLRPDALKQAFFRDLVEAGATVVWGHHPHVLQPFFSHDRGRGVILSSTGNFISGQLRFLGPNDHAQPRAATGDVALYRVTLVRDGDGSAATPGGAAPSTGRRARVARVLPEFAGTVALPDGGYAVYPLDVLSSRRAGRDPAAAEAVAAEPPPLSPAWREFYAARRRALSGVTP